MSYRALQVVVVAVVVALTAGSFAIYVHEHASELRTSPTWGVYTDAQWRSLQAHYGPIRMRTAAPPLAIVSASGCLVVLRAMSHVATVCRPTQALQLFALRAHGMTNLVGIAAPNVASVVGGGYNQPLLAAPNALVFGSGLRSPSRFTAYDARGRVVARLYCASALRAVCGTSEHRRS